MDMARRADESAHPQLQSLNKRLDVLETKIEMIMQKLAMDTNAGVGQVHTRLLAALADWKSTNQLAAEMSYRQEYVSRCVADLRKAGKLDSKKSGKTIFYKIKQ